ncbi:MAG TPA: lipoyl synthase, partial [Accumulibacter sp.]|nr:lipoyl synthase [Accumulibacter sp.]
DILNHNLETVPRLYRQARPGADYAHSLAFMKAFKARYPQVPTKSGLMVGLGETDDEILEVLRDLRANDVEMLTIGQYLAPSGHHLPVDRYVHPEIFRMYEQQALAMGFTGAACGPMVRSSYWADVQAHSAGVA